MRTPTIQQGANFSRNSVFNTDYTLAKQFFSINNISLKTLYVRYRNVLYNIKFNWQIDILLIQVYTNDIWHTESSVSLLTGVGTASRLGGGGELH